MNSFEELFFSLGVSWQNSVILPFVFLLFMGFITGFLFWRKIKLVYLKWFLLCLFSIMPAGVYFAFYPIYHSDVNNDFRVVQVDSASVKSKSTLEIIVLPNCPFCLKSIEMIVELRKRNPKLPIVYKILSKKVKGGDIEPQLKKNQIDYDFISNNAQLRKITKGSFPTFVFYRKGISEVKVWDNNTFGTMALDDIEAH